MRNWIVAVLSLCTVCYAQGVKRPAITGISHASFYTSTADGAKHFYGDLLGLAPGGWAGVYRVGSQSIEAEAETPPHPPVRLSHVAYATSDADDMRAYLSARGVKVPAQVHNEKSGTKWFALEDPEGNPIEFVEEHATASENAKAVSARIIHAGYMVRSREAEDKFYRDILGFRLYWQGGMTDDRTEFVDMQVPDGTDWIEYMLVRDPDHVDVRTLGIVNHVALGVPDIHRAASVLESRGWKSSDQEHPQIGRDGKWQLNLYDPDGTRVELMEFTPVQKPCCSDYVGPHPH